MLIRDTLFPDSHPPWPAHFRIGDRTMSSPQQTPNPQQTSTSSFASAAAAPARTGGNGNVETSRRKNPTASFGPIGTAIVIILIVAGIYYLGISSKPAEKGGWLALTSAWLSMMALLVALCVFLGWVISGRPLGILVGSRNLMSLSRFQMVAWSVVILSAVLAVAFRRIVTGMDPSDLGIDKHLWALLGISTASLVGTPLILQNKTTKDPDPKAVAQTATALQTTSGQTETMESIDAHRQGSLYVNPSIADARITDMFEGDEGGNKAYVELAKE